jgi:hypothetical protein
MMIFREAISGRAVPGSSPTGPGAAPLCGETALLDIRCGSLKRFSHRDRAKPSVPAA